MTIVSVIIPTYNRAEALTKTLTTLVHQSCPVDNYEIIIADNGSSDPTQAVSIAAQESYPTHTIRYVCDPVPGLLTGRHRGALEAAGALLVFVDDDIDAEPGWLAAILATFADPTVQLVGGRSRPKFEAPTPAWLAAFWEPTPYGGQTCGYLSLLDLGDKPQTVAANYVWGLNFAIRRQALFDLGGFHPDCIPDHLQHFQGDGETGLARKANERSYRAIYQPLALVHHRIPASRLTPEAFERRAFYQGVCDSYTVIRRARGLPPKPGVSQRLAAQVSQLPRRAWAFTHRLLARPAESADISAAGSEQVRQIRRRIQTSYQAGYAFHQQAVANEPILLQWVLRTDYWDYQLPALDSRPLPASIKSA